jgi:hypothetical protein
VLFGVFYYLRKKQPIKIRDIRVVTIFVLSLAGLMIFLNLSEMMVRVSAARTRASHQPDRRVELSKSTAVALESSYSFFTSFSMS